MVRRPAVQVVQVPAGLLYIRKPRGCRVHLYTSRLSKTVALALPRVFKESGKDLVGTLSIPMASLY